LSGYRHDLSRDETDRQQFVGIGVAFAQRSAVIRGLGVATDPLTRASVSEQQIGRVRDAVGAAAIDVVVTLVAQMISAKGELDFVRAAEAAGQEDPRVTPVVVGLEATGGETLSMKRI